MNSVPLAPEQVIPEPLAQTVRDLPCWFVIGGQAVRCFSPYRPSVDVDFGVGTAADLVQLVSQLAAAGEVEIREQSPSTVHLTWNGLKVSIFVLDRLVPFTEDRRLNVTGVLATKLHAILDRGTRRDFFDLYVTLQHHQLGIVECLRAMAQVYGAGQVNEGLLLRALTYFEDAEREAALPGEGSRDWALVKDFFQTRVGSLLVPPGRPLKIQQRRIAVTEPE